MAVHPIYQFYAELDDYKPKIWRRFQVSENITPSRLCYVTQVLFEMTASHIMALEVPFKTQSNELGVILRFEVMDDDFENAFDFRRKIIVRNAAVGTLRKIGLRPGDTLNFIYDFGADWRVSLTLEQVFEDKDLPSGELPRVLDGAGFGIVEDVAGTGELELLAKAFKTKKGPDYRRFCEWLGTDDLDMTAFDLADMNFRLKKIPRIYKQSYEDGLEPTQRSIELIERKYLKKQ